MSLANVEKAIRMGFDGYETDLWRKSDGQFVVHHDGTLDRTTTGSGRVSDHSLEQIRQLKLKYPSGRAEEGCLRRSAVRPSMGTVVTSLAYESTNFSGR